MIHIAPAKALTPELAAMLARALPYDTGGPAPQLVDMLSGCDLFELLDEGRLVGGFAARLAEFTDGRQIVVNAAGGLPGYDLTAAMEGWARVQAAHLGAVSLSCTTRRPGLVRKLRRAGYHVAGYVLRKDL